MKAPPNAILTSLRPKPSPRPASSPTKRAFPTSCSSSGTGKRSSGAAGPNRDSGSEGDDDDVDDVRVDKWSRKELVLSRTGVLPAPSARASSSKCTSLKTSAAGPFAGDKALHAALTDPTVVRQVVFDDDARILIAVCDNTTIVRWDRV